MTSGSTKRSIGGEKSKPSKYVLFKADGDPKDKPCAFFLSAEGCKNGAACKFSHATGGHTSNSASIPATQVSMKSTSVGSKRRNALQDEAEGSPPGKKGPSTATKPSSSRNEPVNENVRVTTDTTFESSASTSASSSTQSKKEKAPRKRERKFGKEKERSSKEDIGNTAVADIAHKSSSASASLPMATASTPQGYDTKQSSSGDGSQPGSAISLLRQNLNGFAMDSPATVGMGRMLPLAPPSQQQTQAAAYDVFGIAGVGGDRGNMGNPTLGFNGALFPTATQLQSVLPPVQQQSQQTQQQQQLQLQILQLQSQLLHSQQDVQLAEQQAPNNMTSGATSALGMGNAAPQANQEGMQGMLNLDLQGQILSGETAAQPNVACKVGLDEAMYSAGRTAVEAVFSAPSASAGTGAIATATSIAGLGGALTHLSGFSLSNPNASASPSAGSKDKKKQSAFFPAPESSDSGGGEGGAGLGLAFAEEPLPWADLVQLTRSHRRFAGDYGFLADPSRQDSSWARTMPRLAPGPPVVLALDCEMCETTALDGTKDGQALVRLSCVSAGRAGSTPVSSTGGIDEYLRRKAASATLVIDSLVRPADPVTEMRTNIHGISADALTQVPYGLRHAQAAFLNICTEDTILVGHGLCNDLKALRIVHTNVIDTAYLFSYSKAGEEISHSSSGSGSSSSSSGGGSGGSSSSSNSSSSGGGGGSSSGRASPDKGKTPGSPTNGLNRLQSLRTTCQALGEVIQGNAHDSIEDARSALLAALHIKARGLLLKPFMASSSSSSGHLGAGASNSGSNNSSSMLLHRLPENIPAPLIVDMLVSFTGVVPLRVEPVSFPHSSKDGGSSSTGKTTIHYASPVHAELAFESLNSVSKVDKSNRPQKRIYLQRGGYVCLRM